MAESKTFLKCSAKLKTFNNGGSLISVGVKADDLIAFAQLALELGLRIVLFKFLGLHCEEPT
jgi:hypothetical protein